METSKRGRWRRLAVGGVVGGVLLAGAFGILQAGKNAAQPVADAKVEEVPPVAVTVERVASRPIERVVSVVGSLYGREEITLSPKVEGRVVKIFCDVGDRVKPGTKLLELDPTDYRLAVEEAQRALDLELSRVGLQVIPAGKFDVTQLPTVAKATSMEQNASSRRDRVRRLRTTVAATQEDIDQADADYAVARANSRIAVLEAESALAAAKHRNAILESARQRLADATVVAPPAPAGTEFFVCGRDVAEGEIVRIMPGDDSALFKLVIDETLKLRATVPERYKPAIAVGQAVRVRADEAFPGRTFAGTVTRVNPTVDRASRTFQTEVLVPNAKRELSAGSFVKATIVVDANATALTVPEESIVRFAGVTKVFVVRDGAARQVAVATGANVEGPTGNRKWVEVTGELKAGDEVVTAGQTKLTEGAAVRVRGAGR